MIILYFSRGKEQTGCAYIQKEIYYEGLAHTTMEPGKSHNLPFASPGKPEV